MVEKGPFARFHGQKVIFLDGGLATELEGKGFDLDHPLWSAKLLYEAPAAIRQIHLDYLRAGADIILTASYQATIPALMKFGLTEKLARETLLRSVTLADEARSAFWDESGAPRNYPLIAASIGPYGAYLADGSEYRGAYGLARAALRDFHRPRWELLAASPTDIFACETLPSLIEAEALTDLLSETPDRHAWLSFSCRDARAISDGTPFTECLPLIAAHPRLLGAGINCTAPNHVAPLLRAARASGFEKPLIVYPNSGEKWDARGNRWTGAASTADFAEMAREWAALGARVIGGCCRTGPAHVAALREGL